MTGRRGTAVAIALLAALATAGCGLGPGEGRGDVELTVTRDFGAESLLGHSVGDVTESDTVMRVLDRNAEITTRYGGGFVQSIDGLEADRSFGDSYDWFFYVNGVESTVGAADYRLRGGERIWWDYREWSEAMRVPAVVGSWPQPFAGGYEGKRRPVSVECQGGGQACAEARKRLEQVGADVTNGAPVGAIRVLVGPWAQLRRDPAASQIEDGPQASGVFADFAPAAPSAVPFVPYADKRNSGGFGRLWGLDREGQGVRPFEPGAGLVAATRRYDAPPVWVVTGATAAGVHAAAGLLDAADLRDHYAVATEDGEEIPLPMGS
ncbi:MAG TPA: DUF4430 domain-containing protein [Solirubrobacterales bacterium]|nr:DUF4430 domain-containing protein [Solirubrobacterales bacterium]